MNLKKSLYQTIAFYDLFDFPLTAEEILENLYGKDKAIHIKEIEGTLKNLPGIEQVRDYYVLEGRAGLIDTRKSRKFISEKLWNRTSFYAHHMLKIPFIQMVSVCNNLSYDNASEKSDIDLFIVIKDGRMWTARLFLTIILQLLGVRRHGDKIAGRFCLSFFVTDQKTNIKAFSLDGEDPYLAYWLKHLTPIFGKDKYLEIQKENQMFMESFGLNYDNHMERHLMVNERSSTRKLLEKILGGKLGNKFEQLLKNTFKKKTLRRFKALGPEANVVVTDQVLKFHNNDRREGYREAWQKKVEELMTLPEKEEAEV